MSVLEIVDYAWKVHLQNLDHLKEGIYLRGYGQKNPLYEYKKEAFREFSQMIQMTRWDISKRIFKMKEIAASAAKIEEIEKKKQEELEEIKRQHSQTEKQKEASSEKKKNKKKGGGFFGR